MPDSLFQEPLSRKGLITKGEVRAVTLAMLALRPHDVMWDIGAGSGSVGLEAARLMPEGHVFAIEKEPRRVGEIWLNQEALHVINYHVESGMALKGIESWPDPNAVFIGGSGGELPELIEVIARRLLPEGRLVMNFITLENLAAAMACLKKVGLEGRVTQIQVARSKPILEMTRLQADTPVWVVTARKRAPDGS